MKFIVLLLLTSMSSWSIAQEIGFERGNILKNMGLTGVVSYECRANRGRTEWGTYYCSDSYLAGGDRGTLVVKGASIDAKCYRHRFTALKYAKLSNASDVATILEKKVKKKS